MDRGGGGSLDIVEIPVIVVQIILGFIAIQFFAARVIFEMHVATSLDILDLGIGVVVDFIGRDLHIRSLDADMPPQMAPTPVDLLFIFEQSDLFRIFRGIRPDGQNFPAKIRADLGRLRRRRG